MRFASVLLPLLILAGDTPLIQVFDPSAIAPRNVIVVIDGEPYKAVAIPGGGSDPTPAPEPAPAPDVKPTPAPSPAPVRPIAGKLWMSYVLPVGYSMQDRRILDSQEFHSLLQSATTAKFEWRAYLETNTDIDKVNLRQRVIDAGGAPVAIFQEVTVTGGPVLSVVKSSDPAEILKVAKGYLGK